MREATAAGVPIFLLLLLVALDEMVSRTWTMVLIGVAGVSLLALAIWYTWPREDERDTIQRILQEYPDWACPMCGRTDGHKRRCPVKRSR